MLLSRRWLSARRFCEWMKSWNFWGHGRRRRGCRCRPCRSCRARCRTSARSHGGRERCRRTRARRPRSRTAPASRYDALLEQVGLGELRNVLGGLEEAEGAASLGMHDALRHSFPVERLHLLDHVVVLQQDRAVRAGGEGVLVAARRDPGIGGGVRAYWSSFRSCRGLLSGRGAGATFGGVSPTRRDPSRVPHCHSRGALSRLVLWS